MPGSRWSFSAVTLSLGWTPEIHGPDKPRVAPSGSSDRRNDGVGRAMLLFRGGPQREDAEGNVRRGADRRRGRTGERPSL